MDLLIDTRNSRILKRTIFDGFSRAAKPPEIPRAYLDLLASRPHLLRTPSGLQVPAMYAPSFHIGRSQKPKSLVEYLDMPEGREEIRTAFERDLHRAFQERLERSVLGIIGANFRDATTATAARSEKITFMGFDVELDEDAGVPAWVIDRAFGRAHREADVSPRFAPSFTAFKCHRETGRWGELDGIYLIHRYEMFRIGIPAGTVFGFVQLNVERMWSGSCLSGSFGPVGFARGQRLISGEIPAGTRRELVAFDRSKGLFHCGGREVIGAQFIELLPNCQAVAHNPHFV